VTNKSRKIPGTFAGFPARAKGKVIIPSLFFSELLPQINDLAELKLTLYMFWALQQREGEYRYVRMRDMLADQIFMSSLDENRARAESALEGALDAAVQRGTLLHTTSGGDELYFMNTDRGRRAVEALERGNWTPGTDAQVGLTAERPNIFALYEQNIGALTPILSDILRDAENTYPYEWIVEAVEIAVESNKRSWRYIEAILMRWAQNGKSSKPKETGESVNPYLDHEYFRQQTDQDRGE
jgi:DNA replication protein